MVALFAGLRVSDLAAARAWYEHVLGEPAFTPNATEVGVRKAIYRDADGNEVGFGGPPAGD